MENKISKKIIDSYSCNGLLFYKAVINNLHQMSEDKCFNVSSPFRSDKNPSFQVYRNPATNIWYYRDFGNAASKGDVYDFAAAFYSLDTKTQFSLVLEKMYYQLSIDKLPDTVFERYYNYDFPYVSSEEYDNIILPAFLNEEHKRHGISNFRSKPTGQGEGVHSIDLVEKSEGELVLAEKEFLKKTGILYSTMVEYKAYFIDGYSINYIDKESYSVRKPAGRVWIAYSFSAGCKIYQLFPEKKFWHVGERPKNHVFGTPQHYDYLNGENVFLTAGEKDALCLLSRGYNAFCLNSETQNITKQQAKDWYQGHYNIKVVYDNDETGIKQAQVLYNTWGYPYILLPNESGIKDITDYFIAGHTKEEFDMLVNNVSSTPQSPLASASQPAADYNERVLPMRTARQRLADAKKIAPIQQYFDVLFQSNELVIFFGDTGIGKSVFSIGLADAISKGQSYLGLPNSNPARKVIYFDFELGDKQFEMRYTDEHSVYEFSDNLFIDRVDMRELIQPGNKVKFDDLLIIKIKKIIEVIKAEVLIIDNISFLSTESSEDTQVALSLMNKLIDLKIEKNIAILVLAHTPKRFGAGGLTLADLAGSKQLSNFVDGVFSIGQSRQDSTLKYIKQIKTRSGEMKYGNENVLVLELDKIGNFLTFLPKGCEAEAGHIYDKKNEEQIDELKDKAVELKKKGCSYRQIADQLGVSKSEVGRWLKSE